jgi:hypothetical protein
MDNLEWFAANYALVRSLPELSDEQIELLERLPRILLKFLTLVRLSDFQEMGISNQKLFGIYLTIQKKQGHDSIKFVDGSEFGLLVYNGE